MLPYSQEALYALFAQYNGAVWPIALLFLVLALAVPVLARRPSRQAARVTGLFLALTWAWTAVGFHWLHFSTIHFAAAAYAALFGIQAVLLAWTFALRGAVFLRLRADLYGITAVTLMLAALAGYPAADALAGNPWPQWRLFGVTPGPTMLYTLGVLLLAVPRAPRHLLAIPLLWILMAGFSAWVLGMAQDGALLMAGIAAVALTAAGRRHPEASGKNNI